MEVSIIKPGNENKIDLKELWRYRELFWVMGWRDIKVRYKQTLLGAIWAMFQPLFSMFVFTIFFGQIARIQSDELPYALFVLIGLVFWTYFSTILSTSSNSLIENEGIIKKIYFPRIILPASKVLVALVDLSIAFLMLIFVSVYFGRLPALNILLLLPLGVLISSLGALGGGMLLAAINVRYRDVRYALPFLIQMLVFFTPVIYPTSIMRPELAGLMALNPMTAVIETLRNSFSGNYTVSWEVMCISTVSSVLIFVFGLYYFYRTERYFADIV